MCNTTGSAWAMWAKLSVGWFLWEDGGACAALKGPVTSDAFSCCLQCQRTLGALQEPILVLMTRARLEPGLEPGWLWITRQWQLFLLFGCASDPSLPSLHQAVCRNGGCCLIDQFPALLWCCHREKSSCHHSGSLDKLMWSGLWEACAQQFEHPRGRSGAATGLI